MPREVKRDLRESLQQKQIEINKLKAKNKELFTFLQAERQRISKEIRETKTGMEELLLATNLVLGEIIRKYSEITIQMPDVNRKFSYVVDHDDKSGTMTFKAAPDPEEAADLKHETEAKS